MIPSPSYLHTNIAVSYGAMMLPFSPDILKLLSAKKIILQRKLLFYQECEVAGSLSPRVHLEPHHRLELFTKELQSYKSTSFKSYLIIT